LKESISIVQNSSIDFWEKFLTNSRRNLISYHLIRFPCPYHFPKFHIHRRNRPFVLLSLNEPPSLDNATIRCHKEAEKQGIPLRKYLVGRYHCNISKVDLPVLYSFKTKGEKNVAILFLQITK
jgi:hypothetical protein